ncbi:MAG: maleylpyruvate isomerase N-terminal domain-containing protein, partial [Acidimicrobiia bacterium]|nr:maleylpyruvate isomerase N-terminal domain-containing protein [Acidimicrobiia bacterium]
LIDWLDDAFGAVTAALAGAGPDERVWTWTAENTTGFYRRRMAQETSMHLWDLRTAAHRSEPLEPELAADGIDELFDVLLPEVVTRGVPQPTGSLHLHRTDGDGEWSVELVDGALVASHEHTKGDAAVRGSAGDLLLMMWERAAVDDESLQVFGDTDVVKSWTSLSR